IQAVHGFVLEGRPLKACFGTTKYCHAWLRNVPCSNPDCLYLHEIGSQEDSYTKDEIISAYTRVEQITGTINSMQDRTGDVLPPPADDFCNISSASTVKVACKSATNNSVSNTKGSPPNSSSGRSGLPAGALWGTRTSNNHQPASVTPSNGQLKQKTDHAPVTFSAAVANQNQSDVVKKHLPNGELHVKHDKSESLKKNLDVDRRTTNAAITVTVEPPVSSSVNSQIPPEENGMHVSSPTSATIPAEMSCGPSLGKDSDNTRVKAQNLCSDMSSMNINAHEGILCKENDSHFSEPITSYRDEKTATSGVETSVLNENSDSSLNLGLQKFQIVPHEIEDDVVAFNNQRLKDPELVTDRIYMPNLTHSFHPSNYSGDNLNREATSSLAIGVNFHPVNNIVDTVVKTSDIPVISTAYTENQVSRFDGHMRVEHLFSDDDKRKHMERFQSASGSCGATDDIGENSIISSILSLDFDPWDEPLASRQNLTKMMEDNDHQQGSLVSSSRRAYSNGQSRFSFAREEQVSQAPYVDPSLGHLGNTTENGHFHQDFTNDRNSHFNKYDTRNRFSYVNAEESDSLSGNYPYRSSNKLSVSRSHVSAPPGFSPSNRAPPPGFTSQERVEQSFDPFSGNHMLDTSSLMRNQYQASAAGNMVNSGDIEFMDPAILAVGKGRLPVGLNSSGLDTRSSFPSQYSTYENEARLQLLMERSLSPQQNQRYSNMGNNFTHLQDAYGIPSRVVEQSFSENLSPFTQLNYQNYRSPISTNGHWEGWNDVRSSNEFVMAELLRNERLGFNNFYAGNEESKFRLPSSGDIYNRTFGI
ncbi:hypothetical protein Leryth_014437, partial [Lithospermum erythrorhizon]